jgi:hypothetical protein
LCHHSNVDQHPIVKTNHQPQNQGWFWADSHHPSSLQKNLQLYQWSRYKCKS